MSTHKYHTCIYILIRAQVFMYACLRHTRAYTCTHVPTHTEVHINSCSQAYVYTHKGTQYTHIHTQEHRHSQAAGTHVCSINNTQARTLHTQTHARTHTLKHTHLHVRTRAHNRTQTLRTCSRFGRYKLTPKPVLWGTWINSGWPASLARRSCAVMTALPKPFFKVAARAKSLRWWMLRICTPWMFRMYDGRKF